MSILSLPLTLAHHIITYLYPLYASYKAIASRQPSPRAPPPPTRTLTGHQTTQMADIESWLMYWSVVGAMNLLEGWVEWTWSWLPFYHLLKVAFTLWLVLPQTRGATILYTSYLAPFLHAHEGDIDVAIASAKRRASQAAGDWILTIWQHARAAILGAAVGILPPRAHQR